jgi:hypothetical protein
MIVPAMDTGPASRFLLYDPQVQCVTAPTVDGNWKASPLPLALDYNEEMGGSPLGPSSWLTCPPTPLPSYGTDALTASIA